jgi:hypothetical protein
MSRSDAATRFMEAMERGDWDAAFEPFTDSCRWHSPGARIETVGREAARRELAAFVEDTRASYRVVEASEYKNLTTLFFEGEATVGGDRLSFPGVVVVRWEGDQVAELWGIRG